jgi:hypothetical protein
LKLSPNGWTNNNLALAWLEHFNAHMKPIGAYQLLVINSHESHCSVDFQDLCKEEKIITLCMPPHFLHLLQPPGISCFLPLKRRYSNEISVLACNHAHHISKEDFLPAFRAAYDKTFSMENICAGFRAAGLVPHNLDVVLSKLDVRLRTPTPPPPDTVAWEAKTLSSACKIEAQVMLIQKRMQKRPGSSSSSIHEQVRQLSKGAQQIAHGMVLIRTPSRCNWGSYKAQEL